MDEHTNNSSNQPEVVAPDSNKETPDTAASETAESPSTNSSQTETTSAPNVPSGGSDGGQPEGSDSPESHPSSDTPPPEAAASPAPAASNASPEADKDVPASGAPSDTSPSPAAGVSGPSVPAEHTPTSTPKLSASAQKPEKSKVTMIIAVVVIVILVAGAVIALAMSAGSKKKTPAATAATATTMAKAVPVNNWTGKGNTADWNTAANWSLGVPVSGQSLVINTSTVKQPGSGNFTFQDNVPNLTINKLMLEGTGTIFNIAGDALSISNGISQDITAPKGSSGGSAVTIENSITFSANQTVQVATNNELEFDGQSTPATTTIGTSKVQFSSAKSGDIEVFTPLVGSGEIEIPPSTTTTGNVDFNTGSPDFSGSVIVNSGATIGMGDQNATNNGLSTSNAFGTASITIANGAYLELNQVGSSSYTIPNDINVGGTGGASISKDNGAYTGAISTCITKAQQGCSDGATVTLTGKVTLTGDTQFGAFYGTNSPQVPPSTTATYILKNLVANGHTLTAVTNSKAVIQK